MTFDISIQNISEHITPGPFRQYRELVKLSREVQSTISFS